MPVYEFICEHCNFHGLTEQSIKDPLPETCPDCGGGGPDFHQVYGDPFCYCRQAPTTIAQQAEINAKRVGKEQMQRMIEESKAANHKGKLSVTIPRGGQRTLERYKPKRPWWRPNSDTPLDVNKIPNVKRFIEEGK